MKHLISLIFLACFCLSHFDVLNAQEWKWQNPLPQGNNTLNDVFFIDAQIGWAVGSLGTIIHTTNGGNDWIMQQSGVSMELKSIYFINSQNGWASGVGGTLLRTTNGGINWVAQNSNTIYTIREIQFTTNQIGWANFGGTDILHTIDGGLTWFIKSKNITYFSESLHFPDNQNGWMVNLDHDGISTKIAHTSDGGVNWSLQTFSTPIKLKKVYFWDNQNGWAGGLYGEIIHTSDGGGNWSLQSIGVSDFVTTDFQFIDAQNGWVVGYSSNSSMAVFHTLDGGLTWTPQTLPSSSVYGLHFIDSQNGWVVGSTGQMLYTINGGQTWDIFNESFIYGLRGIHFINDQKGWVIGGVNPGVIFYTSNGGENWVQQFSSPGRMDKVFFSDEQNGWAIGVITNVSTIFHTSNGGQSWVTQPYSAPSILNDIHFIDDQVGWAVGDNGRIIKTINGGMNWITQPSGTTNNLYDIYFKDTQHGWVGGDNTLISTTNGGVNWVPLNGISGVFSIRKLHFVDSQEGWAIEYYDNKILHTIDGGQTWTIQYVGLHPLGLGGLFYGIFFTDTMYGWVVGGNGTNIILHTVDGGQTWSEQESNGIWRIEDVFFTSNQSGWAIGDYGTVLKYSNSNAIASPQITLSGSTVVAGQSLVISGKYFTPNSNAYLLFSGAVGVFQNAILTDASGNFIYTYTAPTNPSPLQLGLSIVKGFNEATGTFSAPKPFKITTQNPSTPIEYLTLTSPQAGSSFLVGENIHVDFTDKLQKKYGTLTYPMAGTTANRQYRYRVEFQVGSSGNWQLATIVQGSALLYSTVNLSPTLQINAANSNCRVRVVDDFVSSIVETSFVFPVNSVSSNLKVEKFWDYSFPLPAVPVQGVAADGVARIYIKVSKLDPTQGAAIEKVDVSLSDGFNNNIAMLGKVKVANELTTYSTEANNAFELNTSDDTPLGNGDFHFWYVAPDDFSNYNNLYNNSSERNVTLHVVAHLVGGGTATKDITIKVVRPPLVMVHGLASSSEAFDDFHYERLTVDVPFKNSFLFKQKRAINISPKESFAVNALQLVSPPCGGCSVVGLDNDVRKNTLKGNIDDLRQQGYAANQVDYVSHSMGGCVLRTAMTVPIYANKFYGTGSGASSLDKSYGKGFVHKAITINTPHEGSPLADFVAEYVPNFGIGAKLLMTSWYGVAPNGAMPFDFIKPSDSGSLPFSPWEASPAINDLRVTDGINLGATTVKNHLISGDIDLYDASTASFLSSIDKYVEFIDEILAAAIDETNDPYLITIAGFNKALRVFTFTEWYSSQKGFPNFLGDGDAIVPRASQLAGSNSISDHSTIFYNSSLINANHLQIVDRTDVGNRVLDLLNSSIFSDVFASSIPATTNLTNPGGAALSKKANSLLTTSFDTLKVVIDAPLRGDVVFADSSLEISFRLKDTTNLNYVQVIFQGQSALLVSNASNQSVNFQVDPNFMGNRLILVDASYGTPTGTDHHIDSLSVFVTTSAQLMEFEVLPEVVSIFANTPYHPTYQATYDAFIVGVPFNDPDLQVFVVNQNVLNYDTATYEFIGIGDGSTFAVISYFGLSDTIYIEVLNNGGFSVDYSVTPASCVGSSNGAIDLEVVGTGNNFSYLWSNGETTQDIINVFASLYSVTVTDEMGVSVVETIEVGENNPPTAFISTTGILSACEGQPIQLIASSVNGQSYQWQLEGINIDSATSLSYQASITGNYTVFVSDSNSCTAISNTVNLQFFPLPNVEASDLEICAGESGQLIATGASTYAWSPTVGLDNPNIANPIASPSGTTIYSLIGTDNNQCQDEDEVVVTVHDLPIVQLGDDTTFCENATYILQAGTGFASYLWSTGETIEDIMVDASGTYFVTVTDQQGCTATDEIVVTETPCNATINTLSESQVQLYPNPNNGSFVLSIESVEVGELEMVVVNPLGQVVTKVKAFKSDRLFTYEFALRELPSSVYLIKIRVNDVSGLKKFVVGR